MHIHLMTGPFPGEMDGPGGGNLGGGRAVEGACLSTETANQPRGASISTWLDRQRLLGIGRRC